MHLKSLFSFFSINKPNCVYLEYVDFIINNEAYFLISWDYTEIYKLSIPELNFTSYKKRGSAYILVPSNVSEISVKVRNLIYSNSNKIPLKRIVIKNKIEYDFILEPLFPKNELLKRNMEVLLKCPSTNFGIINFKSRAVITFIPNPTFIIQ